MSYAAQKHEIARGKIVKILAPEHPHPIDSVMLRRLLDDFGISVTEDAMTSYIAYLEERGYVRTETRKHTGIVMVFATAKGLDLIDGRIDDEGVEVGF